MSCLVVSRGVCRVFTKGAVQQELYLYTEMSDYICQKVFIHFFIRYAIMITLGMGISHRQPHHAHSLATLPASAAQSDSMSALRT
jgi:hypothetical protein